MNEDDKMLELSDADLKMRLEAYNYEVPPITFTTRKVLQRKLAKLDDNSEDLNQAESSNEHEEAESDDFEEDDEYRTIYTNFSEGHSSSVHQLPDRGHPMDRGTRFRPNADPALHRFKSSLSNQSVNKTSAYLGTQNYSAENTNVNQNEQSKLCSCKTILKLILAIVVSFFLVVLYEYLFLQDRKNLHL